LDALRERHGELSLLEAEGRVTAADVALVNSTIDAGRSDSLTLESQFFELALHLGQLVGSEGPNVPATAPTESSRSSAFPELPIQGTDPAAPGPRVLMAEADLRRAEAQRSQSRSLFWPEVSAMGVYTARAGQDRDPIGEWAAGIAVRIPLFDGGRKIGANRGATAAVAAAREALLAEQQNEQVELRIALDRWNVAQHRRDVLAEAVAGRSASVNATQQLYSSGRVSLSELLNQEAELLRLRIDERKEVYAASLAALDYYSTRGMLTPDQVETLAGRTR
jgi:outer membrane protein TolC